MTLTNGIAILVSLIQIHFTPLPSSEELDPRELSSCISPEGALTSLGSSELAVEELAGSHFLPLC